MLLKCADIRSSCAFLMGVDAISTRAMLFVRRCFYALLSAAHVSI